MLKVSKMRSRGCVQMPDGFIASTQVKKGDPIHIHFGSNFGVVVIVYPNVNLSKDNLERIRIITDSRL